MLSRDRLAACRSYSQDAGRGDPEAALRQLFPGLTAGAPPPRLP